MRLVSRFHGLALSFALGLASLAVALPACDEHDQEEEHEEDGATAPRIVAQPADVSVVVGQIATFTVSAEGADLAYQWQSSVDAGANWTNIATAMATSYATPPTVLSDDGRLYRVLVSAAGGNVSSSAAQLTVSAAAVAPTITVHPAAQTVTEPAAAMFSVTTSGTTPAYQWQLSSDDGATWTDLASATNRDFDTGPTSASMSGALYRVRASNSAGSATSMAAVLTVNAAAVVTPPSFTQMPVDQQVTEGTAAVFGASVAGDPAPTLQWQRSNDNGASWTDISGATSASYNTDATTTADHGARFRLVASNSAGSATTDAARLIVTAADATAPAFDEHPAYAMVREGTSVHFSATASGTPTPTYQWQRSVDSGATWSDIVGANNSSYDIPATASADNRSLFRVVASNSAGSTSSEVASLFVCTSGPLTVTHDPSFWAYNQFRNGTGGIFCPGSGSTVEPHPGIPGATQVYGLLETNMSSTQESLAFTYYTATGELIDVSYSLLTPTITSSWLCSTGSSYYKPCGGVTLDKATGQITFTNTVVGEEMGSGAITLNGTLNFSAP